MGGVRWWVGFGFRLVDLCWVICAWRVISSSRGDGFGVSG